jgi:hypothetical protein
MTIEERLQAVEKLLGRVSVRDIAVEQVFTVCEDRPAEPTAAEDDGASAYTRVKEFVRHLRDDLRIPEDVIVTCLEAQINLLKQRTAKPELWYAKLKEIVENQAASLDAGLARRIRLWL